MTILFALLAAVLVVPLAMISVRHASEGVDRIAAGPVAAAALAGAGPVAILAHLRDMGADHVLVLAMFAALLMAAAIVDRETAWAPDGLLFPLTALSMLTGMNLGSWDIAPLPALLIGSGAFLVFHAAWLAVLRIWPEALVPPPSDLLAFLVPFLVIGPNSGFVVFTMAISAILFLCMKSSTVNSIFARPEIVDHVLKNEICDDTVEGSGITFLALAFPLLLVFMVARLLSEAT